MFEAAINRFGKLAVGLYAKLMFRMDVLRHVPLPPGPKIIAPNHPTTTDPFLLLTITGEPFAILIEELMFRVPLFGRYLKWAGHVPVVPENGRAAFDAGRRLLENGRSVAIFPEGAISPLDGGFQKARTGAARLALLTGAPIIPIGVHVERENIRLVPTEVDGDPALGTWYFRGRYAMTVGEPMYFDGNAEDRDLVRRVTERMMRRIAQLTDESAQRLAEAQARAALRAGKLVNI